MIDLAPAIERNQDYTGEESIVPDMSIEIFVLIGAVFGLVGAAMAFLIVADEYRKHRFKGWRLWKEGLLAGALAFAVLLLLSLAAGVWLRGWARSAQIDRFLADHARPPPSRGHFRPRVANECVAVRGFLNLAPWV